MYSPPPLSSLPSPLSRAMSRCHACSLKKARPFTKIVHEVAGTHFGFVAIMFAGGAKVTRKAASIEVYSFSEPSPVGARLATSSGVVTRIKT